MSEKISSLHGFRMIVNIHSAYSIKFDQIFSQKVFDFVAD